MSFYNYSVKITILLIIASVIILSWLPHSDIGNLPIFRKSVGRWINHFGNLRTAVPFVFLGILGELNLFTKWSGIRKRIVLLISLILVVTIAETGQLLLPYRYFDWADIGWGFAGSIFGIFLGIFFRKLHSSITY